MRQEINFYRGTAETGEFRLTFPWLGKAGLALAVVLTAWSLWQTTELRSLTQRVATANGQAAAAEQALNAIRAAYVEPKVDPGLAAEVDQAQRTAEGYRRLLDLIGISQQSQNAGFSGYFDGLARQTLPGVWLTRIWLADGGRDLTLSGSALSAERIPLLMEKLGSESAFRQKTFAQFAINRPERDNRVDFDLRTRPGEEARHAGP